MSPQQPPVRRLVELRDARSVSPGSSVLRHDVHSDFGQIEVSAYACGGRDAGFRIDAGHNAPRKLMVAASREPQVPRGVDEHLVDRIHMDVLLRGEPQIDAIDARTHIKVVRHARFGGDVRKRQTGRGRQLRGMHGGP